MTNGLRCFTLGSIYLIENTMRSTDPILFAFLREEINRVKCGFLCGVKLSVTMEQQASLVKKFACCTVSPRRSRISNTSFAFLVEAE